MLLCHVSPTLYKNLKETGQNSVPEKQILYLGFHFFFVSEMSLPVHLK